MSASTPTIVIDVPWRRSNSIWAAGGSALFALAIGYLAATSDKFAGIYRAVLVVAAVALAYWTVTVALNRTRLELDAEALRLSHGPLPWFGARSYPRDEIARLRANPSTRRLELRTHRGEDHVLLTALDDDIVAKLNAAFGDALDG